MAQKSVFLGPTAGQVILDTDVAGDCDDCSDIAASMALQGGGFNIIGIIVSSQNPSSPMAADACARFCNWNYPSHIGVNQAATPTGGASSVFTSQLASRFVPSQVYGNYPEAVQTYRRLLAQAVNGGITIVGFGFATPLANLLMSAADGYSSLTGVQLVTAKVKQLVLAAGYLPSSTAYMGGTPEFNLATDPAAYSYIAANWPTPVIWGGIEMATYNVNPPASGPGSNPLISPVEYAYNLFSATMRPAYSAAAIMFAAQGLSTNYAYGGQNGTMTINSSTGANLWTATAGKHSYLTKVASDATLQTAFNALIAAA